MKKIIQAVLLITYIFLYVQYSTGAAPCLCPTKLRKCLKGAYGDQSIKNCYISLKGCAADCLPKKRCMRQCKKARKRGKKYCKKVYRQRRLLKKRCNVERKKLKCKQKKYGNPSNNRVFNS